jgi:hypothetical protein
MTTRENGDIRLLVLGSSSGCATFLESVRNAPGIAVVGLIDTAPDPDGLALAREMGVPLCRHLTDFSNDDAVDAVLDFTEGEEAAREATRSFPAGPRCWAARVPGWWPAWPDCTDGSPGTRRGFAP